MRRSYIMQAFTESPWAIQPAKFAALEEIVMRHIRGEKLTEEEVQARIHGAARPNERVATNPESKTVAVLPLFGTIFPRANMMTEVSGATSAEIFGAQFSALADDPAIDAIVLDVNSPGGQVNGIADAADRIYQTRGKKPVIAVANHLMASAAYWIGSAADEIVVTPDADIGSIGVFAVHQDVSRALEQDGVKMTIVKRGKYKTEGNPYEALSEEARANMDARVGEAYENFLGAVSVHRGVSVEDVRGGFGEGRVVGAQQAIRLGMADRIETLDRVVAQLLAPKPPAQRTATTARTTVSGSGASATITTPEISIVNQTPGAESSDPAAAELKRQAQSLRERVEQILKKEN